MAMLVTVPELSLWAEGDAAVIDPADPLAIWLLQQASTLVIDEVGKHALPWYAPGVDLATIPGRAKIVVANIAKRCWNNADQETRTAIAGGPSSSVLDEAALGLRLSDAEIVELGKVREALEVANGGGGSGLWVLPTTRGPVETTMLVGDSAWPQSSPMPYLSPVGDPFYFPTKDDPLPIAGPDAEPTNTPL